MSNEDESSKVLEKADKTKAAEKERFKGKAARAENKARATAGKARRRKSGHEPVSDQKSHEYH